jgi:hypothetical protein
VNQQVVLRVAQNGVFNNKIQQRQNGYQMPKNRITNQLISLSAFAIYDLPEPRNEYFNFHIK